MKRIDVTSSITILGLMLLGSVGCDSVKSVANVEAVSGFVEQLFGSGEADVEAIMVTLRETEKELNGLYKNLAHANSEKTLGRAGDAIRRIQEDYSRLGAIPELPTEIEQEAQMISLRSHYRASRIIPSLAESVSTQADQIIQMRPESTDAKIAIVLKFCSKLDLSKEITADTITTLHDKTKSFTTRAEGVTLYAAVAQEYWKHGQAESAEKVLKTGIEQYHECREKLPLVHQMIDQGHRKPPSCDRLSQKAFKQAQQAMANSFAGSDVKFRS